MGCEIGTQPSLRDSRLFGVQPSVETLGYSRLSLWDSKAAVLACRQNGPGVQQYDSWVMTNFPRQSAGVRGKAIFGVLTALAIRTASAHRPTGRLVLSDSSFQASVVPETGDSTLNIGHWTFHLAPPGEGAVPEAGGM